MPKITAHFHGKSLLRGYWGKCSLDPEMGRDPNDGPANALNGAELVWKGMDSSEGFLGQRRA